MSERQKLTKQASEKGDILSGEFIKYLPYLLCSKQIINPGRFLNLSGLVVLFDKLEFVLLSNQFEFKGLCT